jgi:hypothetical protein
MALLLAGASAELYRQRQLLQTRDGEARQCEVPPRFEAHRGELPNLRSQVAAARLPLAPEPPASASAHAGTSCDAEALAAASSPVPADEHHHEGDAEVPSEEQLRFLVMSMNAPLFRELGLSTTELEATLRALSNVQLAFAGLDPNDVDHEKVRAETRAELVKALGSNKADRFEALQRTLPARAQLRELRNYLEDVGTPIDERQQTALLATFADSAREQHARGAEGFVALPNDAFLARARTILSTDQLQHFEDFQQWGWR